MGDTKAVLFINDDKAETGKLYGILDDGMGTYKDVDSTVQQTFEYFLTALTFHNTCQQGDSQVHTFQEFHDGGQMLLGEDFSRRHDTGLIAVIYGDEHRHQRHKGLARTHIALQQTVHLASRTYVDANFPDDTLLGLCQREGQIVVIEGIKYFTDL